MNLGKGNLDRRLEIYTKPEEQRNHGIVNFNKGNFDPPVTAYEFYSAETWKQKETSKALSNRAQAYLRVEKCIYFF